MRSGSLETLLSCKTGDTRLISSQERFVYTPEGGSGCCLPDSTESLSEGKPRKLALLPAGSTEAHFSKSCTGRERLSQGACSIRPSQCPSAGGADHGGPTCNFILAGDHLAVSIIRNLSPTQKPLVCIWINKDKYFDCDEAFIVAKAD